jgi:hypothetical protein
MLNLNTLKSIRPFNTQSNNNLKFLNQEVVRKETRYVGIFLIKTTKVRTDPTSYFFYIKNNGFINHEVYKGKAFYKQFSAFIFNTILDQSDEHMVSLNEKIVFIPKYYNNIRLVRKMEVLKGFTLKAYDSYSKDIPKHLDKWLNRLLTTDLTVDNVSRKVEDLNNTIPSISDNVKNTGLKNVNVKPENSQKRLYSTDNKSAGANNTTPNRIQGDVHTNTNDSELNISVLQALGLDPSKIHITKECTIDNKPLSWSKDNEKYVICPSLLKLDEEFIEKDIISTFEKDKTYSMIPVIYNKSSPQGQQCISLSRQILVTNAIEPATIVNFYKQRVEVIITSYSGSEFEGEVIFRIIPVSASPGVYKRITDSGLPDSKPNFESKSKPIKHGCSMNMSGVRIDTRSYSTVNTNLNNLPHSDTRTDKPNNEYDISSINLTPLTTDLTHYGAEILEGKLYDTYKDKGILYQFNKNITLLVHNHVDKKDDIVVRSVTVFNLGVYSFDYKDTFTSKGSTSIFTRDHSGVKLYICSITRKVLHYDRPFFPLYIKPRKAKIKQDKKISTFDIETYTTPSGLITPYASGWYNGVTGKYKTYYITDYKNDCDIMLSTALRDLSSTNPGTVYVHNLSKFDAYFILKIIYDIFDVKPLYKDRIILQLDMTLKTFITNSKKYNKKRMVLKDSFLLLPESLKRLGTNFNTNIQKGYFPYEFVNKERLEYIGDIPNYQYFKNQLTQTEYDVIKNSPDSSNWDLKKETIKYLEQDIKTLCEVLNIFSDEIWDERVNITKCASLSGLAYLIFKTNYIKNSKLSMVKGIAHENMRKAYYGGRCEVFIPLGLKLKSYDCNSIYPYCMLKDMPVGQPVWSNDKNLDNIFGIVYAKVKTIKNTKYPFIPFRNDTGLLFPLGNWEGWYFSEELKYAIESGYYQVEVIHSYKFERGVDIFKDYVEKYYGIKSRTRTSTMGRPTAKLLLNGLYGRFGMNPHVTQSTIITRADLPTFILNNDVIDYFTVFSDYEWVTYTPKKFMTINIDREENCTNPSRTNFHAELEQSVQISIAITAYARIEMNEIIKHVTHEQKLKVFMTDTDCIWMNGSLSPQFVGPEIGKFKKEISAKEAYFPAPKFYYTEDENGHVVKKSKGVNSSHLTKDDYISLGRGMPLNTRESRFLRDFRSQNIYYGLHKALITGINKKRLPVYDNNGVAVDSKPLHVKDGVILTSK